MASGNSASWLRSEALRLEGDKLQAEAHYAQAVACYQQALALEPTNVYVLNNMAPALLQMGHFEEAEQACRKALLLRNDLAELHYNLGRALAKQERFEGAIEAYRQALQRAPQMAEAHNMLGNALRACGQVAEAERSYRQAVKLRPVGAEFHVNLALICMLQGNYPEGLPEFEWRLQLPSMGSPPLPQVPRWQGEPLEGRTLLVRFEGGFGDTIHFMRYLSPLRALGAHVVLECQPELATLLAWCADAEQVIAANRPELPRVPYDLYVFLLSLPCYLWKDHGPLSQKVPYIFPPPKAHRLWKERLGGQEGGLKVGIVWAGSPSYPNDRRRSCPFELFLDLALRLPASFYSLQKGEAADQARALLAKAHVYDLAPYLNDFADTAAAIACLDLVVSVDTSVAHLAGAMGKPVWLLLPFAADWRWGVEGATTIWYPTMRLFRQKRFGVWETVFEEVSRHLTKAKAGKEN